MKKKKKRMEGRAVRKMETFEQGSLGAGSISLTWRICISDTMTSTLPKIYRDACVCDCVQLCKTALCLGLRCANRKGIISSQVPTDMV